MVLLLSFWASSFLLLFSFVWSVSMVMCICAGKYVWLKEVSSFFEKVWQIFEHLYFTMEDAIAAYKLRALQIVYFDTLPSHVWDLLKSLYLEKINWQISILISCFQEWVTDSPFIISPRITFEVSVRLLGGLMALGYTIAAILKRSSHVFHDNKVSIKTDWLEQLNRQYVQV